MFYPLWDRYLECIRFQILNTNRPFLFLSHLFIFNPTFLHNIKFESHNLSFLELLICRYNYNFGPKYKIDNLLPLVEDMGFKRKPLYKKGKVIQKGKSKICIIIKSNGGSLNKGYQCGFTIKTFYLLPLV